MNNVSFPRTAKATLFLIGIRHQANILMMIIS